MREGRRKDTDLEAKAHEGTAPLEEGEAQNLQTERGEYCGDNTHLAAEDHREATGKRAE